MATDIAHTDSAALNRLAASEMTLSLPEGLDPRRENRPKRPKLDAAISGVVEASKAILRPLLGDPLPARCQQN